jgi:hypothetical protein
MKTAKERMWERMRTPRVMTSISLRIPESVIESLKEIAPSLGFSGYQGLIKSYISQGLRKDLERLDGSQVQALTESLRKQGIADELISAAIADAGLKSA